MELLIPLYSRFYFVITSRREVYWEFFSSPPSFPQFFSTTLFHQPSFVSLIFTRLFNTFQTLISCIVFLLRRKNVFFFLYTEHNILLKGNFRVVSEFLFCTWISANFIISLMFDFDPLFLISEFNLFRVLIVI